jgi:predicted AAA+ superfamily ATPase
MSRIREVLVELNPWWKGEFSLEYGEREVYGEIQKFALVPQMIALTGLRRVGKTTLMLKIVEDAIRKGFSSRTAHLTVLNAGFKLTPGASRRTQ